MLQWYAVATKKFNHELLDKHQHNTTNKINQNLRAMYHNITSIVAKKSKMNRYRSVNRCTDNKQKKRCICWKLRPSNGNCHEEIQP